MAEVRFTSHLRRYFPDLATVDVQARTVAQVIEAIEARWPGIAHYLVEDGGALRKHVNVFVDTAPITDRVTLTDPVGDTTRVDIMQALSGG